VLMTYAIRRFFEIPRPVNPAKNSPSNCKLIS